MNKFDIFEEVIIKRSNKISYVIGYVWKSGFMWYELSAYEGIKFKEEELEKYNSEGYCI